MMAIGKKLLEKLLQVTGIGDVLEQPAMRDKKLLKGNVVLGSKRIYKYLCLAITFAVLLALNLLFQFVTNIGKMVQGSFSPLALFLPSFSLLPVYFFGLLISATLCFVLYFKLRINFQDLNVGQKGHARFLTQAEIAQRFTAVAMKDVPFQGWGGAPVSRQGNSFLIDAVLCNLIVYAVTRGGKTEGVVVQTIDIVSRAAQQASMIILDVKGNLTNTTARHLLERGYEVYIINLFEPEKSNFYNPLEVIRQAYWAGNIDMAEELTTALAYQYFADHNSRDSYWVEAPRALISAFVLALVEDCMKAGEPHKVTIYSMFVLMATLGQIKNEDGLRKEFDAYFESRPVTNPARLAFTSIEFSEGRTRTSVLSITAAKLDPYRRSNIAKMTSANELKLTQLGFGEKPIAVFLRVPFYNRSYDAMISTFISQAFYMNMEKAAKETYGAMPRRVRVVGDEFFNFPALHDFDNMVTVCLGAGWSFDLYAQSVTQVEKIYGKEVAKIVLDNCATTYFLASPDKDTRERVSEMCGKVTTENVTRSGERFSINKTITEQYEEYPLIPAQELSELRDGEMIVFPTMARKDLTGNKVKPLPIFNRDENSMLYRHEYLAEFDPTEAIPYQDLSIQFDVFKNIKLEALIYQPPQLSVVVQSKEPQDSLLAEVLNSTQLTYLHNLLKNVLEINPGTTTVNDFLEIIRILLNDGSITQPIYKTLRQLCGKVEKKVMNNNCNQNRRIACGCTTDPYQ